MAETRPRQQDADSLRNMVRKCMDKYKHNWITYREMDKVHEAPTVAIEILTDHNLFCLEKARELDTLLNFIRENVEKAIDANIDEKFPEWGFQPKHRKGYRGVMTNRFMNLCRVVSQADAKKKRAKWTLRLPWNADLDAAAAAAPVKAPAKTATPPEKAAPTQQPCEDTFSFNIETLTAFRYKGGKKSKGHPSLPVQDASDKVASDAVVAIWDDGFTKEMPDLCYDRLRNLISNKITVRSEMWVED